jgi:hypothetical protein
MADTLDNAGKPWRNTEKRIQKDLTQILNRVIGGESEIAKATTGVLAATKKADEAHNIAVLGFIVLLFMVAQMMWTVFSERATSYNEILKEVYGREPGTGETVTEEALLDSAPAVAGPRGASYLRERMGV